MTSGERLDDADELLRARFREYIRPEHTVRRPPHGCGPPRHRLGTERSYGRGSAPAIAARVGRALRRLVVEAGDAAARPMPTSWGIRPRSRVRCSLPGEGGAVVHYARREAWPGRGGQLMPLAAIFVLPAAGSSSGSNHPARTRRARTVSEVVVVPSDASLLVRFPVQGAHLLSSALPPRHGHGLRWRAGHARPTSAQELVHDHRDDGGERERRLEHRT